jgi:hypothetical protein
MPLASGDASSLAVVDTSSTPTLDGVVVDSTALDGTVGVCYDAAARDRGERACRCGREACQFG